MFRSTDCQVSLRRARRLFLVHIGHFPVLKTYKFSSNHFAP